MTKACGGTDNPSTVIFAVDALIFALLRICGIGVSDSEPTMHGIVSVVTGAVAMGAAYAAWTYGMSRGNITILAAASYFTPVLSSALAAILLSAALSWSFWQGAGMVCLGSLLCWYATRR